jgi:hypothetical protein
LIIALSCFFTGIFATLYFIERSKRIDYINSASQDNASNNNDQKNEPLHNDNDADIDKSLSDEDTDKSLLNKNADKPLPNENIDKSPPDENIPDLKALYEMALNYENGTGVQKDYYKAFELYKTVAEYGHSESEYNTDDFYFYGKSNNSKQS